MTINPAAPAANQARQTPHSVVIEDRKRLTATGILSIVSYDSFTATLETPGGTLAIGGEGLTVSELSAVSYTHLDVYKRQAIICPQPSSC